MQMRPSRVLKKLRNGEVAFCAKTNLLDPRSIEIMAMCDFDCVWVDLEHLPNDWGTMENMIRAAKMYDVDTVVRVSRGSYSDLIKPLEADAAGIMVPHLMSLEDAKEVVWRTRFHPIGRRPADGGNADGSFCMLPFQEYIKVANEQRFVIVQIEDPEPLDQLEAIAELDGIDMLFFGPGDFSQGIGFPGQGDHPKITETRKRIAEVARKAGKFAGTVGSVETVPELIDMGYQFVNVGADVIALGNYFKDISARLKGVVAERTGGVYDAG